MHKLIVGYVDTDEGRDALALGRMLADATGAEITTATVEDRSRARALQELAEQDGADAIVLGSTRRGTFGRVLAGSVAERLLTGAPCAIAVAPRGYADDAPSGPPRVIAVGFDGSTESWHALARAQELAETCSATLRVTAVAELDALFGDRDPATEGEYVAESERHRLERELGEALDGLPRDLRTHGAVIPGKAAEVLAGEAGKGVDLLVVGSRSHGPVRRAMLGSVSSKLVRTSPCPVLVVPRSNVFAEKDEAAPGAARAAAEA